MTPGSALDGQTALTRHAPESLAQLPTSGKTSAPGDETMASRMDPSVQQQQPRDIYKESLRALRGRYPLVVTLAFLGAVLGAVAGYVLRPPRYRAEGLLRIAYAMPPVLQETDQNKPMAMFEGFLQSQMVVMQSQRVLSAALQTSQWQATGRGSTPVVMRDFISDLTIDHPTNTDYVRVVFEDTDPTASAIAVNVVMQAYSEAYAADEKSKTEQHLKALEDGREDLKRRLDGLRAVAARATAGAGLEDLQTRYKSTIDRINMLESRRADVRLAIETSAPPTTAPADVGFDKSTSDVSLERLARTDSTLQGYLDQRRQLQRGIEQAQLRYGAGNLHPDVVDKRKAIEDLNDTIDRYVQDSRALAAEIQSRMSSNAMATTVAGALMNRQSLEAQERIIAKMLEESSHAASDLDAKYRQAKELADQEKKLSEELESVEQYIRLVQLESHGVGRLSIVSAGEVPVQPFYNPRKKFVAAGAAGAACLGPGLVVLFGLLSGKYRFAHDTEDDVSTTSPLLAILPTVSESLSDLMQASDVAQSIHHLRVLLQAERKQQSVFMITSACSGEGKTSLAVSLGLSFAASGARTLLIDCDLVGQGITRGFGLQGTPGVREALAKNSPRGSVKRMAHGMRLMPAGNADPYTGWTVSPYEIGKLVRDLRPYYEVILIDTGPILGSVEACVVAPEVDGVIMAISRGQQRTLVDRALQQVMSLGARPAGFVFNRANKADFSRSAFHSSTRKAGSSRPPVPASADEPAEFQNFGPVVRAVAMFMPQLTSAARAN